MGKHTRAFKAELERKEQARRRTRYGVLAAIGAVGITATSFMVFGSNEPTISETTDTGFEVGPVPDVVFEASQNYVDAYGCADQDQFTFSIEEDLDDNPVTEPLGRTRGNDIAFSTEVRNLAYLKASAIHETGHACTVGLVMFEVPFEGVMSTDFVPLVGSDGLKPYFADDSYVTEMEEGVVEWLSQGVDGYIASSDTRYRAVSAVMNEIASQQGITREQLADLHQSSDLIGFVALAKNKQPEDVNIYDITDVVSLFQTGFYDGIAPSPDDIAMILSYQTSFAG